LVSDIPVGDGEIADLFTVYAVYENGNVIRKLQQMKDGWPWGCWGVSVFLIIPMSKQKSATTGKMARSNTTTHVYSLDKITLDVASLLNSHSFDQSKIILLCHSIQESSKIISSYSPFNVDRVKLTHLVLIVCQPDISPCSSSPTSTITCITST
jgi:hypothetical protein